MCALAWRFHQQTRLDLDDLRQEGRIAAATAAESYVNNRGATLKTWATNKAKYAMLDYIRSVFGRKGQRAHLHNAGSIHPDDGERAIEISAPVDVTAFELEDALQGMMLRLQKRDRWIVRQRLAGCTMREIGQLCDPPISESRVCQMIGAIRKRITA